MIPAPGLRAGAEREASGSRPPRVALGLPTFNRKPTDPSPSRAPAAPQAGAETRPPARAAPGIGREPRAAELRAAGEAKAPPPLPRGFNGRGPAARKDAAGEAVAGVPATKKEGGGDAPKPAPSPAPWCAIL
jgi:hypothetical protein